jgi:hypothetical protein
MYMYVYTHTFYKKRLVMGNIGKELLWLSIYLFIYKFVDLIYEHV